MKSCFIRVLCPLVYLSLAACKTASRDEHSKLRDVSLINSIAAKSLVIYQDGGQVFLKTCQSTSAEPANRNCSSQEPTRTMPENEYFDRLPFDVAPYERNEESLQIVSKFLENARAAVQAGNQNATAAMQKLEATEKNLKTISSVRVALKDPKSSLTYFEYQDEFQKLLAPFGVIPIKQPQNGAPSANPAPNGNMTPKKCFSILRTEISKNWYDESLWPVCLSGGDLACIISEFRLHPDSYPEDLPGLCGGDYHMRNQPDFDVVDMPKRPEMQPDPRPSRPTTPINSSPGRPSGGDSGGGSPRTCSFWWAQGVGVNSLMKLCGYTDGYGATATEAAQMALAQCQRLICRDGTSPKCNINDGPECR